MKTGSQEPVPEGILQRPLGRREVLRLGLGSIPVAVGACGVNPASPEQEQANAPVGQPLSSERSSPETTPSHEASSNLTEPSTEPSAATATSTQEGLQHPPQEPSTPTEQATEAEQIPPPTETTVSPTQEGITLTSENLISPEYLQSCGIAMVSPESNLIDEVPWSYPVANGISEYSHEEKMAYYLSPIMTLVPPGEYFMGGAIVFHHEYQNSSVDLYIEISNMSQTSYPRVIADYTDETGKKLLLTITQTSRPTAPL